MRILAALFIACFLAASSIAAEPLFRHEPPEHQEIQSHEPSVDPRPAADPAPARKPVRQLVYCTAAWCAPCQRLKPVLAALTRAGWKVGRYGESCHIAETDDQQVFSRLGVSTIPTFVLLHDGIPVQHFNGASATAEQVAQWYSWSPPTASPASAPAPLIEQLKKFAGSSGQFRYVPDSPINVKLDDGTVLTYTEISGTLKIDDKAHLTLSTPQPHVAARKFGLTFGAMIQGLDYPDQPGTVGVQTTRGLYRIRLEPAQ